VKSRSRFRSEFWASSSTN